MRPTQKSVESAVGWAAIFLVVFFARVALIGQYSTDVAFWDQWNSEGGSLIARWLEGSLQLATLFEPHNEHRIFFTRVITLGLFLLNEQQWDNYVSAVFNAALWAGTLASVGVYLRGRLSPGSGVFVWLTLVAMGVAPFGWENLVCGFQSQFYLLAALTLASVGLAASSTGSSKRAAAIGLICLAALFTMASGLLAAIATLGVLFLKRRAGALSFAAFAGAGLPLIGCVILGGLLQHHVPETDVLRSQNLGELLASATVALSWPFAHRFPGLLIWIPVTLLAAVAVLNPRRLSNVDCALIGLGLWVGAQAFAIAFARGHDLTVVPSRYSDVTAFGALVAVVAGFRLWELMGEIAPGRLRELLVAVLFAAVTVGLLERGVHGMGGLRDRRSLLEIEAENVRAYVWDGTVDSLYGKPPLHIPFPEPAYLQQQLDNPFLRASLPPSVRIPLPLVTTELEGFAPGGTYVTTPSPRGHPFIGSYLPALGDGAVGRFQSAPFKTRFSHLLISTAGYLGREELRLEYSAATSTPTLHREIRPEVFPRESWVQQLLEVPPEGLVLSGYDQNPKSWFAVTAPTELGRLGAWVRRLFAIAIPGLWASALLFVCVLAITALRAGRARDARG